MDNRVKFYSWLIGLLDRKHLTFEEIANEWRDANANQDEDELDKRTFHRYRENIQSQFGITVECDKSLLQVLWLPMALKFQHMRFGQVFQPRR